LDSHSLLPDSGRALHRHPRRETTTTRYFHTDHLGSIAVITNETGGVMERLSYNAWGVRRHPDGTPDPAGALTSQLSRGFTGHEHLEEVGLIHMNGRVYDPLLARFGTPDPMTENPFSTQGWNRWRPIVPVRVVGCLDVASLILSGAMSKHFRPWKIDQQQLLPPSVQDYVCEDHVSRFIVALVRESLDLCEIEAGYPSALGQPPFIPP
jgi:RHS repeat-associated protein